MKKIILNSIRVALLGLALSHVACTEASNFVPTTASTITADPNSGLAPTPTPEAAVLR